MAEIVGVTPKADREARAKRMAAEGRKAAEEYATAVEARDINMARLKALRLEKEEAEAAAKAAAPPPAAKTRKRATTTKTTKRSVSS